MLPLSTCSRTKEHTKLTLNPCDREKPQTKRATHIPRNLTQYPRDGAHERHHGVRLENHPRTSVMFQNNRSQSTKCSPCLPPAKSKARTRASTRLNTGVSTKRVKPVPSHLLKSGVSQIKPHQATTVNTLTPQRRNPLTSKRRSPLKSHRRTTSTTRGKPWSVVPLRLKAATISPRLISTMRRRASSKLTMHKTKAPTTRDPN